jgi:Mg/Co/Ni transporter MgtE
MAFTMEDFNRQYIKEHFSQLTQEEQREALARLSPEHRREVLQSVPPEERLAGLSPEARLAGLSGEEVRHLLDQLAVGRAAPSRKPRRRK